MKELREGHKKESFFKRTIQKKMKETNQIKENDSMLIDFL